MKELLQGWRLERALFRYTVVSQVRAAVLGGSSLHEAVQVVAARGHAAADGRHVRVSQRSIYRWLAAQGERGIAGLGGKPRTSTDSSTVLPEKLLDFLLLERARDKEASIPELLLRATHKGLVEGGARICRQTVYRALCRMGVSVARRKKRRDRDARRFAYPHRMEMVLCDGKHFRAGAGRLRRVAFFYLDDATRLGLNVVVGTSETSALFLRGLYGAFRRYGRMLAIYLDHGPGFIARDSAAVCARLDVHLVLGEASYPEAHGKIERFNQTAKRAVLRNLDKRPDIDPECRALELRLRHWLFEIYNHTPHEGLPKPTEEVA